MTLNIKNDFTITEICRGFARLISSARGLKAVGISEKEEILSTIAACATLNCSIIFSGETVAPNESFNCTHIYNEITKRMFRKTVNIHRFNINQSRIELLSY